MWSRLVNRAPFVRRTFKDYLFRGFGVELLSFARFGPSSAEQPKPVFQISIWLALCHCCVHLLPLGVSIILLVLNLNQRYVGFMPGVIDSIAVKTALLQIASKAQELLIVASLTTIVMHYIRRQLVFGQGLPLGVISSGFLFNSLSYFWSPDFWGSMKTRSWPKYRLALLLFVCGLLAATAGPATAVLIIPRIQNFDAGKGQLFLGGSADTFWPQKLSGANVAPLCQTSSAVSLDLCPSGGFFQLWRHAKSQFYLRSGDSTSALQNVTMQSSLRQIPSLQLFGNFRAAVPETTSYGLHLASAILQLQFAHDWDDAALNFHYTNLHLSPSEYKYRYACTAGSQTKVPAVRVACSDAQNVSSSTGSISFPVLPISDQWQASDQSSFTTSITDAPADTLRATWVTLPPSFGSVSTGLVVETPLDSSSASRVVVGCSIDARWTDGTTMASITGDAFGDTFSDFRTPANTSWTQIAIQQDWLAALTPQAPYLYQNNRSQNLSTLEYILLDMGFQDYLKRSNKTQTEAWNSDKSFNRSVSLEWTLSNLFADGLSRHSAHAVLNTTGPPDSWGPLLYQKTDDFDEQVFWGGSPLVRPSDPGVEQQVAISITGYAYLASKITDYLAVAVLLGHMLLAAAHTAHLVWTRQHSSCWDTLTELLALALNSRPASALQNTGAGMTQLRTFAKIAHIGAVRTAAAASPSGSLSYSRGSFSADGPQMDRHVELLFHGEHENGASGEFNAAVAASGSPEELSLIPSAHGLESSGPTSLVYDKGARGAVRHVGSFSSATSTAPFLSHASGTTEYHRERLRRRSSSVALVEEIRPGRLYG